MTTYIVAATYDAAMDEADGLRLAPFEWVAVIPERKQLLRGRRWVDGDRLVLAFMDSPSRYATALDLLEAMIFHVGCPRSAIERAMEEAGLPIPESLVPEPVDDATVAKTAEAVRKIERSLR